MAGKGSGGGRGSGMGGLLRTLILFVLFTAVVIIVVAGAVQGATLWPWWLGSVWDYWIIVGGGLLYVAYKLVRSVIENRVIPSWEVYWQQWRFPKEMVAPDPRDVDQIKWANPQFDPTIEIDNTLRAGPDYFLGLEDPPLDQPRRKPRPVIIPARQLGLHFEVIGATGSGKSALAGRPIIEEHIARGYGVLMLTFKGDAPVLAPLIEAARRCNRLADLRYVTLTQGIPSHRYNPLASGPDFSAAERVTKAIGMRPVGGERFFVDVVRKVISLYRRAADRYGHAATFRALSYLLNDTRWVETRGRDGQSIDTLVGRFRDYLSGNWGNPARNLPPRWPDLTGEALSMGNNQWRFAGETRQLTDKMAVFPSLNATTPDVTFLDALRNNRIVVMELASGLGTELTSQIAAMALDDLLFTYQTPEAGRTDRSDPFLAVIDEFASLTTDTFLTSLQQARSFNVWFGLLHQSFADLDRVSPAYSRQVAANVATRIVFKVASDRDAKEISGAGGATLRPSPYSGVQEQAIFPSRPGNISQRKIQAPFLEPNVLLRLPVMAITNYKYSKAVVIGLDGVPRITTLRPLPRLRELEARLPETLRELIGPPEPPRVPGVELMPDELRVRDVSEYSEVPAGTSPPALADQPTAPETEQHQGGSHRRRARRGGKYGSSVMPKPTIPTGKSTGPSLSLDDLLGSTSPDSDPPEEPANRDEAGIDDIPPDDAPEHV
jgi:hypothetical protein